MYFDSTGETVCLLDNQSLKVFGNMVTTDFNIAYDAIDRWTAIRVMDNKKDYSVQITEISMYAFEGLGEDLNGNYSEQDPTEFYISENGETAAHVNSDEIYTKGDGTFGGDLKCYWKETQNSTNP